MRVSHTHGHYVAAKHRTLPRLGFEIGCFAFKAPALPGRWGQLATPAWVHIDLATACSQDRCGLIYGLPKTASNRIMPYCVVWRNRCLAQGHIDPFVFVFVNYSVFAYHITSTMFTLIKARLSTRPHALKQTWSRTYCIYIEVENFYYNMKL